MGMIRQATLDDVPELMRLGLEFYTSDGREVDLETMASFFIDHIRGKKSVVFINTLPDNTLVGGIAGLVAPHYLIGQPTAFKSAWYVSPKYRFQARSLFKRFEKWASEHGAQRLIMTARQDRTVAFLEKSGYVPFELVMQKDLKP
jgi:N-acetylglutamate synthase-like GNAT family acetyltransferase